jgi:hypothetical protein
MIKPGGESVNQCRHNLTDPTTVFTPCNVSSCGELCILAFVRTTRILARQTLSMLSARTSNLS